MNNDQRSLLIAERCLLVAVRNQLVLPESDGGAGFDESECQIEADEMVPSGVGHTYVAVVSGGISPGPRHKPCGGIWDHIFACTVSVIQRVTHVPRDRTRGVFLTNLDAIAKQTARVMLGIDFRYEVTTAAETLILAETGSTVRFHHPLVFAGLEATPRHVGGELFADMPEETRAGLARKVFFNSARRTVCR